MIKRFFSGYLKNVEKFVEGPPGWQETFMKYNTRCKVIAAVPGKHEYEFEVTKDVLNSVGSLHGGALGTLLGVCMANVIYDGTGPLQQRGVAIQNTFTYISSAKLGDTIVIKAQTLKHGKRLAFLEAKVYRKSDNLILATGKQCLAITPLTKEKK